MIKKISIQKRAVVAACLKRTEFLQYFRKSVAEVEKCNFVESCFLPALSWSQIPASDLKRIQFAASLEKFNVLCLKVSELWPSEFDFERITFSKKYKKF